MFVLYTANHRAMASLLKLRELETINVDLSKTLSETKQVNEDLLRTKERLKRDLEKLKGEYNALEDTLSTTLIERESYYTELKNTQTALTKTKEDEVSGEEVSSLYDVVLTLHHLADSETISSQ